MKILFVCSYHPPYSVGGAEESAFALARALRHRGHTVTVVTPLLGPQPVEDEDAVAIELGYRVKGPGVPVRPRVFDNPGVQMRLTRALQGVAFGYDLIHAQSVDLLPAAWVAARRAGVPIVASIRDLGAVCPVSVCLLDGPRVPHDCGVLKLERTCVPRFRELYGAPKGRAGAMALVRFGTARGRAALLRQCDAVVSVGSDLGRLYADAGLIEPEAVSHIPNIAERVEPDDEVPAPGHGLKAGEYALYAGKISHGKGASYLLEAVERASRDVPSLTIAVAGRAEGSWGARLHDAENVTFLGRVSRSELAGLYRHARFALVPSIWPEPFPRAAIEAGASGLAVIGTRAGGIPDAIAHRRTGLLVEPRDATALAEAIVELWNDPELARRLGKAAKADVASRFSAETVSTQILALYRRVSNAAHVAPV